MTKCISHTFDSQALQREGLPEMPAIWEDGQRGEPQPSFFERWQFDACLSDGSVVMITFFTKPLLERSAALRPGVSIAIVPPGGKPLIQAISVGAEDFSASKERCYVRIGESWVRGDPEWCYELHVKTGSLAAHLNFTSSGPAWRPGAGKFYGESPDREPPGYFAWLVGIPQGHVEGILTYAGKIHPVEGSGYHDHRWGNIVLNEVFKQWYVGRAQFGEMALVFLQLTGSKEYGGQKITACMLVSGGRRMITSGADLILTEGEFLPDPGGRSYPDRLSGDWTAASQSLHFALRDPQVIDAVSLVDFLPTWKRLVGGLLSNPYLFTFSASLELNTALEGKPTLCEGQALYELVLLQ